MHLSFSGEMFARIIASRFAVMDIAVEDANVPCQTGREKLVQLLEYEAFDYVIITSPESASVFAAAWEAARQPPVR